MSIYCVIYNIVYVQVLNALNNFKVWIDRFVLNMGEILHLNYNFVLLDLSKVENYKVRLSKTNIHNELMKNLGLL